MRLVVARKEHMCEKSGQPISEGEKCFQSQGFYGLFWHFGCYDKPLFSVSETTAEKKD
jgi:hypothetical protein